MLVIIIIGLLAAILLPQLQGARRRAMAATLRTDLRTLAMHEESHYYDNSTYTDDLAVLRAAGYRASPEVTITVNEATFLGWSATVQHAMVLVECYMFVGNAAPVGTATDEGDLACT
jgi:type II secretory pathway pseudopilin PulG